MRNAFLILLLGVLTSASQTTIDFTTAGVRGGIPYYTNAVNAVTDYGATGDGSTDDYSAITNAMGHCPNGGAVYLPAGTYRITQPIRFRYQQQIVLRGAGPNSTFIVSDTTTTSYGAGGLAFYSDTDRNTPNLTAGYTAGSYTLTVDSASGLASNHIAQVRQSNDVTRIFGSLSTASTHWQRQMSRITNISGTTVKLDRPLYMDYSNSLAPVLWAFTKSVSWSGAEHLSVKITSALPANVIKFYIANNCWLTNVVTTNSNFSSIAVDQSYAITVAGCMTRNHQTYDSNTRYGVQVSEFATDCLIVDNILQGNNLCITTQQGASGNVIAYNFSNKGFNSTYPAFSGTVYGGIAAHGDFSHHNLFEGNVVPWFSTDEFWGVNTTNTVHRNWLTRYVEYSETNGAFWSTQGATAMYVDATNYQMQVTGNIIGHPRDSGIADADVWRVGYARRQGNDYPSTAWDPVTTNTLTKTGNYDFSTNGTFWASGSVETLTNSYWLSSKPSWFGRLAWPPIGPDVNTTATITNSAVIPAQARFLGQDYTTIFVTNSARSTRLRGWRGF